MPSAAAESSCEITLGCARELTSECVEAAGQRLAGADYRPRRMASDALAVSTAALLHTWPLWLGPSSGRVET